jgi:aminopeptidase P (EC:3.4.11.9). Metallo peptidase. MEROPS family M24B
MSAAGVAIIPTAIPKSRNSDVQYPFRGDSDFLYLTGFVEPEAVLVLVPGHADGDRSCSVVRAIRSGKPGKGVVLGWRVLLSNAGSTVASLFMI